MLSKNNRIQKKKDIERIFKEGKSFREDLLVLKTVKNNLDASRFGFIVSRKISKKANIRNKIKRRLREIVKSKMKLLKSGTDNLLITLPSEARGKKKQNFFALPGIEKKESFKALEEIIEKLFKKVK